VTFIFRIFIIIGIKLSFIARLNKKHLAQKQGRPVRALCDAYMHHGRGGKNTRKVCKNM